MVLATDEVYTYIMYNYAVLNWLSHTEAGGDTTTGAGGVPAFVSVSELSLNSDPCLLIHFLPASTQLSS